MRTPPGVPPAALRAGVLCWLVLAASPPARAQSPPGFPVVSRPAFCVTPLSSDDAAEFSRMREFAWGGGPLIEGGHPRGAALGSYGFAYLRHRSLSLHVSGAYDGLLDADPGELPFRASAGWERPVQFRDRADRGSDHGAGLRAGVSGGAGRTSEAEALAHVTGYVPFNVLPRLTELRPAWVLMLRARGAGHRRPVWSPCATLASWQWAMFASDLALEYSLRSDLAAGTLPRTSGLWQLAFTPGWNTGEADAFVSFVAAYEHPADHRTRSRFSVGATWFALTTERVGRRERRTR